MHALDRLWKVSSGSILGVLIARVRLAERTIRDAAIVPRIWLSFDGELLYFVGFSDADAKELELFTVQLFEPGAGEASKDAAGDRKTASESVPVEATHRASFESCNSQSSDSQTVGSSALSIPPLLRTPTEFCASSGFVELLVAGRR